MKRTPTQLEDCASLIRGLLTVDEVLNHRWFDNVPDIEVKKYAVASTVSLRKMDAYFGHVVPSLRVSKMKRTPTQLDVSFDFVVRQISERKETTTIRRKVRRIRKIKPTIDEKNSEMNNIALTKRIKKHSSTSKFIEKIET